jgi:LCP family protein required for cell wall assembly
VYRVTQVVPDSARHGRSDQGLGVPPAPRPSSSFSGAPLPAPSRPLRGRHATGYDQGFGGLVRWTILGSILPGAGLVAAGRRTAGWLLLTLTTLVVVGLLAFATFGDLTTFALRLATNTTSLALLALGAVLLAVLWAFVVLGTHLSLRRFVSLTGAQRALSSALVAVVIGGGGLVAYEAASYSLLGRDTLRAITNNGVQISGAPRPKNDQVDPWAAIPRVNVLLIGSDAGADRKGVRTDSILLASIDTHTGDTVVFGLPRNLQHVPFPAGTPMAEQYPDGYSCQSQNDPCLLNALWQFGVINADNPQSPAHSYYRRFKNPGLQATIDGVEGVTGLKVNEYALLNLAGFEGFVNAIGGLDVNVRRPIPIAGHEDANGHQVGVKGYIQPGKRHLNGYLTMWYARSRSDSSDYDRMQRQRCVLGVLSQQTNPVKLAQAFPQLARTIQEDISTSIPLDDLGSWVTLALRIKSAHIRSLPFTDQVISTGDPDFDTIHRLVEKALETPTAPATTKPRPSGGTSTTKPTTKAPTDPSKAVDVKEVC